MKHVKRHRHQRLKLVLTALAALVGGVALISLSMWMRSQLPVPPPRSATASAPASAPSAPAAPIDPKRAATQNLSGIALLFGLACLVVAAVFVILLIVDIRNARPAWQTQHKYPKRR